MTSSWVVHEWTNITEQHGQRFENAFHDEEMSRLLHSMDVAVLWKVVGRKELREQGQSEEFVYLSHGHNSFKGDDMQVI